MTMINRKYLLATILCVTFTAPALAIEKSATAASQSDKKGVAVSYADLDLNRPEGLAELQHRLAQAAKRVCYMHDGTLSLPARIRRQECFDVTMKKAADQIGINKTVGMVSGQ